MFVLWFFHKVMVCFYDKEIASLILLTLLFYKMTDWKLYKITQETSQQRQESGYPSARQGLFSWPELFSERDELWWAKCFCDWSSHRAHQFHFSMHLLLFWDCCASKYPGSCCAPLSPFHVRFSCQGCRDWLCCLVELGCAIKSLTHKREIILLPLSGRRNYSLYCHMLLSALLPRRLKYQLTQAAFCKLCLWVAGTLASKPQWLWFPFLSYAPGERWSAEQNLQNRKRQSHLTVAPLISCQIEWRQPTVWI